jgi:hypothetical protein
MNKNNPPTFFTGSLPALFFALLACLALRPSGAVAAGLNDTGITTCSDETQNGLPCPVTGYPGQDAQYGRDATQNNNSDGRAGFSFTKLDGTGNALPASAANWNCVRDNVTGLVWEVKTDDGGLHDKDHTYTWYQPDNGKNGGAPGYQNGGVCTGSSCDTHGYVQAVNAQGWCGASDWRMPSRRELVGLVDYGRAYPNHTIDTDYFSEQGVSYVWSGSPYANRSNYAWGVDFGYGGAGNGVKSGIFHVRLVRGGQ